MIFPNDTQLNGVDGRPIKTYGHCSTVVGVKALRRDYKVNFILTDMKAILGADFLVEYGLSLNMKKRELGDSLTGIVCTLFPSYTAQESIRLADSTETCRFVQKNCPEILTAPDYPSLPVSCVAKHSIETIGRPLFAKPRPLSHSKLEAAKT